MSAKPPASDDDTPSDVCLQLPSRWDALLHDLYLWMTRRGLGLEAEPVYLGRYQLERPIGSGGRGLVLQAYDPELRRAVAIKICKAPSSAAQSAFLSEARILAQFSHPNVVAIHDAGHYGDAVFFVMELVEGVDGHQWMETVERWEDAVDVYIAAGQGLAAAHAAGIIHADFKPANLLIGRDGRARVADFGFARTLREGTDGKPSGGTAAYMSLERLAGAAASAQSDQYAFAVSLWETLHRSRQPSAEAIEVRSERHQPLWAGPSVVPARVQDSIRRGLASDPTKRYPDMKGFVDALTRVRRPRATSAPFMKGTLVGVASVLAVAGAITLTFNGHKRQSIAPAENVDWENSEDPEQEQLERMLASAKQLARAGEPEATIRALEQAARHAVKLDTIDRVRVAEASDLVGMVLFDKQEWLAAIRAHGVARQIYLDLKSRDRASRSRALAESARVAYSNASQATR